MKKLLNILTLCCCIFWAACSDDETTVSSGITVVSTSGIDFSAGGGEGTIVVSADGAVAASSDEDWCTVTVEGMTIHVTAAVSTEMSSRSALITISSETGSAEVPVVQSGVVTIMNKNDLYHTINYAGGTINYSFKTNTSYSITISEDAKSWLSYEVDEDSNELVFTVAKNDARTPRGAEVTLVVGGDETVLGISQIEVQREDLAGEWDCSYLSFGSDLCSGTISMVDDPENGLMMSDLYLTPNTGALFPLSFENGILFVKGNVELGLYNNRYLMVTATVGSDGYVWRADCQAIPQYKNGRLVYHFGYSYNEALGSIGDWGFCVMALNPQTGQSLGLLERYDYCEISKSFN